MRPSAATMRVVDNLMIEYFENFLAGVAQKVTADPEEEHEALAEDTEVAPEVPSSPPPPFHQHA